MPTTFHRMPVFVALWLWLLVVSLVFLSSATDSLPGRGLLSLYSPYHRPLSSHFPFLSGSLPFGFYCGEFSPHLRWLGFPEFAISTTTLRNHVPLGLHVIYFYYHAARAALPFSFSQLCYYEAVARYCSYLWLPMTGTAAWNFDVSVERKFSNVNRRNNLFSPISPSKTFYIILYFIVLLCFYLTK